MSDQIALVTDRTHQKFGDVGLVKYASQEIPGKEPRRYTVRFSDRQIFQFPEVHVKVFDERDFGALYMQYCVLKNGEHPTEESLQDIIRRSKDESSPRMSS